VNKLQQVAIDGSGKDRLYNSLRSGYCEANPGETGARKPTNQPVTIAKSTGASTPELRIILKLSPWFPTTAQNVSTVLAPMVMQRAKMI
jgi:hypothetical protein